MKEDREIAQNTQSIQALERPLVPLNNYGQEDAANREQQFLDYWHAIRKRLWMVMGIVVLITTVVAIYMARMPDIFLARSRVEVDLENLGASLGLNDRTMVLSDPQNDPTYFNTQLQILTGTSLLRRVVKTLDLEHNKSFAEPNEVQNLTDWESFKRQIGLGIDKSKEKNEPIEEVLTSSIASSSVRGDMVEAKRLTPYVQVLQRYISVEPVKETRLTVKETRLIDVRYQHPDPQLAAKIVNAVADTFVLSNLERKTESTVYTGDFLQKRIAELQGEIRTGEEKLLNYAKSNQILSLDPDQNTVVERLTGLNKQLLDAENDRKTAEAAYRATLNKGAAEAFAEDNETPSLAQQKLYELQQKRAQLLTKYTEEWGEVKEVNQQIEVLINQIQEARDRAVNTVLTKLKTTYQQTAAREQAIRQAYEQQRAETLIQNEAAVNYQIIKQEIETNKKLLEGLLEQSKANDVMLAGTPNNIHVVDYGVPAERSSGPPRLRNVGLAFIASLFAAVGLALFLDYIDHTIHTIEDIESRLQLPALAVIPLITGASTKRMLSNGIGTKSLNHKGKGAPQILIDSEQRSLLAESFRQLRTYLMLSATGPVPQVLLVTSSIPSEGKTTTATNVALSLEQTGAKVLLIDADLRRPRIHSIFGIENEQGLSSLLEVEFNEYDLIEEVQRYRETKLYVLPSGPIPTFPAELVGSPGMRRIIETMRKTVNFIVIDSPPVTSVTDSVLLSSMADGVLLVVQGGKTSREAVARSNKLLVDVGARVLGVVLNRVSQHSPDYYYYSGYYR